jgi:hypothetical protein
VLYPGDLLGNETGAVRMTALPLLFVAGAAEGDPVGTPKAAGTAALPAGVESSWYVERVSGAA